MLKRGVSRFQPCPNHLSSVGCLVRLAGSVNHGAFQAQRTMGDGRRPDTPRPSAAGRHEGEPETVLRVLHQAVPAETAFPALPTPPVLPHATRATSEVETAATSPVWY